VATGRRVALENKQLRHSLAAQIATDGRKRKRLKFPLRLPAWIGARGRILDGVGRNLSDIGFLNAEFSGMLSFFRKARIQKRTLFRRGQDHRHLSGLEAVSERIYAGRHVTVRVV
jgi:hypothetical protein